MTTRIACGVAVAVVLFLGACERDHPFQTVAVYEAPRGGYAIRIEGGGIVRAGDDLCQQSSGMLKVSPANAQGGAGPSAVVLPVAMGSGRVRFGNEQFAAGSGPDKGTHLVSRLLSEGGYAIYPDEVDELVSAVEGVLSGPKGTFMSGQTRVLRVVSVSFVR